ncbi:MAG: ArsR family transcriptional regulator [Methanimicrococcus sp.]|nr:ArsR family transcriptional regulator [Methanimicrococcus sp.]
MEPSEFLDILGNENRRKIIALLAERPYYVSEITTRLNVSPKAVIGHLSLLENSRLIESSTDSQRRKYYSISKSLRLEVSVSPYSYSVHVNNIKLEMPEDPVYSLSLSFDAPKSKRKSKKTKDIPTGPVIHLAPFYAAKDGGDRDGGDRDGGDRDGGDGERGDDEGGSFTIEIIGPSHPFYEHVGLLHGDAGRKYLGPAADAPFSDEKSKWLSEDELNSVYDDDAYEKHEPEIIFPNRRGVTREAKKKSGKSGEKPDAGGEAEPSRLQSREGYFLSRIFNVRDDLDTLWEEQQELSRLQEDLTVRQSRLMNLFVHYATQLSDDKVDLDILFRLLKEDMTAAELCHTTGHAPSLVLPRLMNFEEKKMVEKYLQSGDFMWRLKDGSDV